MDLNIENAKIELIQWLTTIDDTPTLKKLLRFRESIAKGTVYHLSDSEKEAIEKGLEDSKNGDVVPHTEARKIYEKWL